MSSDFHSIESKPENRTFLFWVEMLAFLIDIQLRFSHS